MKIIAFKIFIIICIMILSVLFYRNLKNVKEKIANQDIVLELVANHDGYHEIYMKQFEGIHSKEETLRILKEVYLNDSYKILKPQIQIENRILKTMEDISEAELDKFENYKFNYLSDSDIIQISGVEEEND